MTFPRLPLAVGPALDLASPAAAQGLTMGDLLARSYVHGLLLDPEDSMRLTVTTHHGLFATDLVTLAAGDVAGGSTDCMGFSADPGAPDTHLASGHPAEGGNLGVIRSADGDARPAREPETLFAATEAGLRVSRDDGLTWAAAHPAEAPASLVDAGRDGRVLAFVLGEGWVAAEEEAPDWEALGPGAAAGPPLQVARDAADPGRLVVSTSDKRLLLSTAGGRDWTTLALPAT